MIDAKLLAILVCPACRGALYYHKVSAELICTAERLAFPIRDDIPIMLVDEARPLQPEEQYP
jgi:uncharacterized protein YbaR (Trm112 family)